MTSSSPHEFSLSLRFYSRPCIDEAERQFRSLCSVTHKDSAGYSTLTITPQEGMPETVVYEFLNFVLSASLEIRLNTL